MVNTFNDLAINGGNKEVEFEKPHYKWPDITNEQQEIILNQLVTCLSERDNTGVIGKFEKEFAQFMGIKYALALSSATGGIHAMSVAASLKPGDEILCPVYTFHATMSPFAFEGIKTILCDSDPNTGCISVESMRERLTPKTKAVIITHIWGIPCDMDKIKAFCEENALLLFEDCAHAQFSTWKGQRVGTFGDMAAFCSWFNARAIARG